MRVQACTVRKRLLGFILEGAQVGQRTVWAQRFARPANVASVQNKPVVGVQEKFPGDSLE